MRSAARWLVPAALALAAVGCGGGGEQAAGGQAAQVAPAPDPLVGVWLETIPGQEGRQGWQFEADGAARALNMFSFEALRWERFAGDSLRIWSRTARYPEPDDMTYGVTVGTVAASGARFLTLAVPGDLERTYFAPVVTNAADGLIGRWTAPDSSFVDITPFGSADFRVAFGSADSVAVFTGTDDGDGIAFPDGEASATIRLVPGDRGQHLKVTPGRTYARDLGAASRVEGR